MRPWCRILQGKGLIVVYNQIGGFGFNLSKVQGEEWGIKIMIVGKSKIKYRKRKIKKKRYKP